MNKEIMQNSGVEWIGEIPQDWKIDRLKNIADIRYGLGQPPATKDDGIPMIRATDVSRGKIADEKIVTIDPDTLPLNRNPYLKEGEIIVVRSGAYTGDSAIVPKKYSGAVAGYDMVVTIKRACPEFIGYCLLSSYVLENQLFLLTLRAAQPHLNSQELGGISLLLPKSIEEQQTIADYLDNRCGKLDAVIALKQQQIKTLDALRQSIIYHAVTKGLDPAAPLVDSGVEWLGEIPKGWKVERIGDVSLKIGSGVTPKGGSTVYLEEGIPLLRSQNIHFSGLRIDDVVFISEETHQEMQGSQVQNNDVLLNITGASLGRCFYFSDDCIFKEANVNQHVCIIRPNHQILTKFLYFFLSSDTGQKQIFSSFRGASREGLNFKEIKTFKLGLPPVSEQQTIVAHLDHETARLNRLKDNLNQQINTLQAYKKALIYECVTGKKRI